ncbi:MAG: hypothetical protein HGB12_06905, partial [Bacteroidetes bacterium]|nr:hypothetical protein [Bacteroidota bacterium]
SVPAIARATSYTWSYSGTGASIVGSTNAVIVYFSGSATSGNLTVKGTNACGNGTISADYPIAVNSTAPNITAQPTNPAAVCTGTGAPSFTVTATGALTYQWQEFIVSWNNVPNTGIYSGAYSATLTITNPTLGMNAYKYRCVVSGACTSSTTDGLATLTVNSNLTASVSIGATATTFCSGTNVTFTATPTNGGSAPAYQWKVNGSNVGTNSATYSNSSLTNGNTITCVMTSNATPCLAGSPSTSNTLTMTVTSALTCNLAAYWKFDESSGNAIDATGNGNTGTISNVTYTSGKINNAATASNGGISNASCSWGAGKAGGTVSFWFNLAGFVSGAVDQMVNAGWTDYGIRCFTHDWVSPANALFFDGLGWSYNAGYAPSTGIWYHIVLTSNGTNAKIYINGSLVTTQTISGSSSSASNFIFMKDAGGSPMNGRLDEVGIWTRELSSTEVTTLYNSGNALQYPF